MNPTTNQSINNNNGNGKEGLVNKLQEALAKFRKDRDQLHRSRELALERCRLIKAEEEALSKTVQTMKDKHNHLLGQTAKIESGMGPLEAKVQTATNEMQFQHAELLGARAKIQQLTNQLEETSKGQQKRLQQAQQLVCDLRSRQGSRSTAAAAAATASSLEDDARPSLNDQIRGLKKEMDHNLDFMDALSKAMDESIRQMESKVQFYRIQSNRLEEQMGLVAAATAAPMVAVEDHHHHSAAAAQGMEQPHHEHQHQQQEVREEESHHGTITHQTLGGNDAPAFNPVTPVAAGVRA